MRGKMWTTRDGTTIPIRQMTDAHLNNAIRMMERAVPRAREVLYFGMENYAVAHDETIAADSIGSAADEMLDNLDSPDASDVWPAYADLIDERERRLGR